MPSGVLEEVLIERLELFGGDRLVAGHHIFSVEASGP